MHNELKCIFIHWALQFQLSRSCFILLVDLWGLVVSRVLWLLLRGVDADLILRLWAQRIAPELTRDAEGNELPVPRYCEPYAIAVLVVGQKLLY